MHKKQQYERIFAGNSVYLSGSILRVSQAGRRLDTGRGRESLRKLGQRLTFDNITSSFVRFSGKRAAARRWQPFGGLPLPKRSKDRGRSSRSWSGVVDMAGKGGKRLKRDTGRACLGCPDIQPTQNCVGYLVGLVAGDRIQKTPLLAGSDLFQRL